MENVCINCMSAIDNDVCVCPYCGSDMSPVCEKPFLPTYAVLGERYVVGSGLEIDGEGLSYAGYDKSKKCRIYIREFYPSNFCMRAYNDSDVIIQKDSIRVFNNIKEEFVKYFRSLARLRNIPALTEIYDIFEENGTAYIIMQWVEGTRLNKYLAREGGYLSWNKAKTMFMPLLSSLSHMSAAGINHLGICPDNIIVTQNMDIKLTGFSIKHLRYANSLLNSQIYHGCSAVEQYLENFVPSEATDVYGFAASLFFVLTGEYPPSAPGRKQDDRLMMPQNILASLPANVISAMANALRVYPNSRTLSFETLRIELSDSPALQLKNLDETEENIEYEYEYQSVDEPKKSKKGIVFGVISCAVALAILVAALAIYWFWFRNDAQEQPPATPPVTTAQPSNPSDGAPNSDDKKDSVQKMAVPDLTGRNFKNLQEELASNVAYKVVLLSEEFHDSVGEGCIISQTPTYGKEMDVGSTIAVTVSKGSQKRILPAITGKTLSEASALITNAKLKPSQTNEFSSDFAEGVVIGYKNRKAGETADYGTEVVIVVSRGLA